MINCKICEKEVKSIRSLSKHIRDEHGCSSKNYYDQYILTNIKPNCKICNKKVKFINLSLGYHNTCSRICGAIFHRKNLSANEEKNKIFAQKVANNQRKIWEDRTNEEIEIISKKISKTLKQNNSELTKKERQDKFGWIKN